MRNTGRILAFLLAAVLVLALCACGGNVVPAPEESKDEPSGQAESPAASEENPPASQADPEEPPYTVVSLKDAAVGDVIVFGSYEQDNNDANGKEPLEWLVLARDGNSVFAITLYAVEYMQFHSSLEKVTWETSAVRAWLNGDFLHAAFSGEEAGKILTTTVAALPNPDYPNSKAGNDTEDKLFLLSLQEAQQYFADNQSRICAPTETVAARAGVFAHTRKTWYSSNDYICDWWLRSPGMYKDLYVSYVNHSGSISGGGQVYLTGTDFCVRPAMWINAG